MPTAITDKFGGYRLDQFTDKSFNETRSAWTAQVSANPTGVFSSEFTMILNYCSTCRDYHGNSGNSFAYGIFKDNSGVADAIVELVYQKQAKKWLKLLNLHLSPELDVSFATQTVDLSQITTIFSAAVVGTIILTSTNHPTKVTKLYGRSGTLLAFLKGLGAHIQQNVPEILVSIEGRWLVMGPKVKAGE